MEKNQNSLIEDYKEKNKKELTMLGDEFINSGKLKLNLIGDGTKPFLKFLKKRAEQYNIKIISSKDHFKTCTIPTIVDIETEKEYKKIELYPDTDIDMIYFSSKKSPYQYPAVTEATANYIIKTYGLEGTGLGNYHILIIGRGHATSELSKLLIKKNATVTVSHSHTKSINELCQLADIIVNASPLNISNYKDKIIIDIANNNPREIGITTNEILIQRTIEYYIIHHTQKILLKYM